jgi:hypothetical protein
MPADEQDEGEDPKQVRVPLDPWSNSPTGDEDWEEVVYHYPESDETWEVSPG